MSYRTFKRLLGETSLERKCRFLFGGGLMLLISGSFYFYAWLNLGLIEDQNEIKAKSLVPLAMAELHWKWWGGPEEHPEVIEEFFGEIKPDDVADASYALFTAETSTAVTRPDAVGYEALEELRRGESRYVSRDQETGKYHYFAALRAEANCIGCHHHTNDAVTSKPHKVGDLLGMVKVTLPLAGTQKAVARNNAILLTTAIVTSFLAMAAAYVIVRYVIVKPVLHLKNVSDEIARGKLDLRADIRTGDEFEELSHAFNRMLRHLVTVQDELREVNTDLDGKVDELAQVNLRLYEMNKLKDEFLATMSHELRTPLNSILGFSEVLAGSENLSEKQVRFAGNIRTSGRELMHLIDDLLDLAKIESGKMEVQIVEFSISELIDQQMDLLLPMAEKKNISLTSQLDSQLKPLIQDAGKLQQILNNLLSNAIKFTPEGGRVRIRVACCNDDSRFELIVEDTGIGIPLEEQELVFEKFRQGQSVPGQRDAMTREYGGTGLGLSIVKELAKLLGGEVVLESEFGKGSTFIVRLPCRIDQLPTRLDNELRMGLPDALRESRADAASQESSQAADADEATDADESAA